MIELYTWSTSNGRKISIALEEMELDYRVHPVDISAGEQFGLDFISRFPNAKIPAIIDGETGVSLFESGAILIYLAEKAGRFLPPAGPERWAVLQWLMWQMGGFGPMLGQAAHFLHYQPGKSEYAAERYGNEAQRLYSVLDGVLERSEFVAGDYSIADMAIWPWVTRFDQQKIDLTLFPNVWRWHDAIARRPAVQRGFAVPDAHAEPPALAV
jgi:GST-like protein